MLRFLFLSQTPKKRRSTVFQSMVQNGSSMHYSTLESKEPPLFKGKDIPKQLASICIFLEEIAASQRSSKRKAEQKLQHQLVRQLHFKSRMIQVKNEWARVFSRFDYFFLFVFEILNLAALGVFLQAAWLPVPDLREQIL